MKILILRFSSIGDIVLTTPIIRCLKMQVPNAEVHFATKKSFQSILSENPYIDKVHVLSASLGSLINDLKLEKFDVIIDLHHNLRTQIIKLRLAVKSHSFSKLNIQKFILTNFKVNKMPNIHIVDRFFETVKSLNVKNDGKGLDYFIPKNDEVELASIDNNLTNDFIALAIGAKFQTKQMPLSKLEEVCTELNMPIVLLGGKEDNEKAEQIINSLPHKKIYNLCGKLNLNQSASIVKQSKLVLTHDTGLMHIASAFQKNIVSVWGNTVPEFGMYPYLIDNNFKVVEVKNLSCRPCSKIGYKKCPKGHFKCMNNIDAAEVIKSIHSFS